MIPLYTRDDDQIVYKCYLTKRDRWIVLLEVQGEICYPIYIGNKQDVYAKNITSQLVKKHMQQWYVTFERDLDTNKYDIYLQLFL